MFYILTVEQSGETKTTIFSGKFARKRAFNFVRQVNSFSNMKGLWNPPKVKNFQCVNYLQFYDN